MSFTNVIWVLKLDDKYVVEENNEFQEKLSENAGPNGKYMVALETFELHMDKEQRRNLKENIDTSIK